MRTNRVLVDWMDVLIIKSICIASEFFLFFLFSLRYYHRRKSSVKIMAYMHMFVLFLCFISLFEFSIARNNITTTQFLRDPETIESSNGMFKFGFFSPINTTNRYVGIWYSNQESDKLEVVWVGNRENPINDSSGVFKISKDGNLQLMDGKNEVLWSSNVSQQENNLVVELLDSGNLVLRSNASELNVWQSFEHPTDSFLPQMKFTIHESERNKQDLFQSWKSPSDPSRGKFTVGINTLVPPQVFLWNDDHPNWRNSPWNGNIFLGKGSVLSILTDNDGTTYFGYPSGNQSTQQHFVVSYDGSLVQKEWNTGSRKWEVIWSAQEFDCNNYGKCGAFGICNQTNSIICGCLKGFVPKNYEEWSKGNWTDGCVRRTSLLCETKGDRADVFWKLGNVKVPDNAEWFSANGEDDCRSRCLGKCSCNAYSYFSSIGCMIWNGSLIDTNNFYNQGMDLSLRLAYSELGKSNQQKQQRKQAKTRKRNIILVVMVIIGITTAAAIMYFVWRWMRQRNGVMRITSKEMLLQNTMLKGRTSKAEVGDLPVFGLKKLAIATDNFQDSNKLGRGGFGTVYKGKFEDGQEIAVKRLSKASGQGLEEFMTEVLVISKLQHRNLVKLLGCCVEGEEKMLVYELMPNKSLDALLFDPTYQKILDWEKRLNIILGICRGLLYLHRDSRLRIIHRDLKASNILLDGNLNPKISDFGMARIFGGNQDQGDTNRIVGTYGYMSPEYAMEGRFSEKSDVFSFGVLLLEVLSGRRNSSFKNEECSSLLGHAWNLWNEDNILSLIDPTISENSESTRHAEILKCIQLGLLCVQEVPEDRPSVSMVISMIESQVTDLPHPTQPGFTQRRIASHNEAQQNAHEYCSVDRASITVLSGR